MKKKSGKKFRPTQLFGASQLQRYPKAMDPEYVRIDERTPTARLSFMHRYAKSLQFFEKSGKANGDWTEFLENDSSIYLAIIAHAPVHTFKEYSDELEGMKGILDEKEVIKSQERIAQNLINWAYEVGEWHHKMRQLGVSEMINELHNAISDTLAPSVEQVQALFEQEEQLETASQMRSLQDDPTWALQAGGLNMMVLGLDDESMKGADTADRLKQLNKVFQRTIQYLVTRAKELFDGTLERDDHQPHTAMVLTFLELFEYSREKINAIGQRHLDFYYRDVLRLKHQQGRADSVYISFIPVKDANRQLVEKGTPLYAGKLPNGEESVYETDRARVVTQAKITEFRTLFLEVDKPDEREPNPTIKAFYAAPVANSADGLGKALLEPKSGWPTFGQSQSHLAPENRTMQFADVGFILSQRDFFLSQGVRTVSLRFYFESFTLDRATGLDMRTLIKQLADRDKISREAAIFRIFSEAFLLSISTAKGWYEVQRYSVVLEAPPEATDGWMQLSFTLAADEPAWQLPATGTISEVKKLKWPALRVKVNPENPWYAFSYVNGLKLDEISTKISVKGVKQFSLYNQNGVLDGNKPFQPFGPVPHRGDYLLIGNSEVFCKRMTSMDLQVKWQGLPKLAGGFEAYYEAYDLDTENDSFKANLTVLTGGKWKPYEAHDQQVVNLFNTYPIDTPEGPSLALDSAMEWKALDMKRMGFSPTLKPREPNEYGPYTSTGYFKLELTAPEYGFGDEAYRDALARVTIANARKKQDNPLPNPPFVPVIREMEMNYTSMSRLDFSPDFGVGDLAGFQAELYHINPFGTALVRSDDVLKSRRFVPYFEEGGYLLLGIEDIDYTDKLCMLFEFCSDNQKDMPDTLPVLRWEYLRKDRWISFDPAAVVSDSTYGFLTSGIIELLLPKDLSLDNTILPGDKQWIRINIESMGQFIPNLIHVHTQAVKATWVMNPAGVERLNTTIAPYTIKKPAGKLPKIKSIIQPLRSFGNRGPEDEKGFYTRVSERLRHKNRCQTTWDTQRLVLQAFPEVISAKVVRQDDHATPTPGRVMIAVVSDTNWDSDHLPKVAIDTLMRIEGYVKRLSGPFARIKVKNVIYEELLVNCKVRFTDPTQGGYYVNKLNWDVLRYISPWKNEYGLQLAIGTDIETNSILSFIENLPYVTYVTAFSVECISRLEGRYRLADTALSYGADTSIQPGTPRSLFVSAFRHRIESIEGSDYEPPKVTGLGRMQVGLDFIIVPEGKTEKGATAEQEDLGEDGQYGSDYNLIVVKPE